MNEGRNYKNKIEHGLIHCHTQNSKKDSALTVQRLVERAKELECPAITLTNHGVMLDIYEFLKECKKQGIKGIPGVEAYYKETENVFKDILTYDITNIHRAHLLLLAKDEIGFKYISKLVSESYNYLDHDKHNNAYPCINLSLLKKYFGEGTEGYGHIFVTTACMAGIPAQILLFNHYIEKEIEKYEKMREKYSSPTDKSYISNKENLEKTLEEIKKKTAEKNEYSKISKKKTAAKEKRLEALKEKNDPSYEEKAKELEEMKKEIEEAGRRTEELKQEITELQNKKKSINAAIKSSEKDHEKWQILTDKIVSKQKSLLTTEQMHNDAKNIIKYFDNMLGHGNFYIEMQYHYIEEEQKIMPKLTEIAKELNIPMVAANDVHIATNSEDDILARQLQRSLRFNKWEEPTKGDKELYIKTDKELSSILLEILPSDIVDEAMMGIKTIIDNCNVELKPTPHYPKYISDVKGETADGALRRLAYKGINWRFKDGGWDDTHQKRLEYELDVISKMGYSDYHLIVQDFLQYGRLLGKLPKDKIDTAPLEQEELRQYLEDNNYDVGLGIGPGRGSGVGSLVCYLLGITALDPLKYDLLFERFLNVERVSMPDIDSDFKTDIRARVIDYCKYKYGEESVCRISTKGTQAAKAAIRNCARILGSQLYNDSKAFLSLGDEIAKTIPTEINIKLSDCDTILEQKFGNNKHAMQIIHNAKLTEGCVTQYGIHAGGVIIADGNPVSDYVPMMFDEDTNTWKTQCDMVESEENGLLKMDFLNLNNLDVITDTLHFIKQRHGISIDIEKVPVEAEVLEHIYAKGLTNAVFQFESVGMKSMLKQFKPDSFEDLILLVAAYRPGPMQYLNGIIEIKRGRKKLTYLTPELEPILNKTYGSIIYQEQVMRIFQDLAGYSLGQADLVRRAMSKKKTSVLEKERESFINGDLERNIQGCKVNGISSEIANQLFDEMMEFAKYAFNKSHAAVYALVSYMTAYLKYHYPVEYLCSVMMHIKSDKIRDKIPGLMTDLEKFGIKLLCPSINDSSDNFSIIGNNIIFGLGSIKGVGVGAKPIVEERKQNGKYKSFIDFVNRTVATVTPSITNLLISAGAFDCFCGNREAMLEKTTPIYNYKKNIISLEEKMILTQEKLEDDEFNDKLVKELDKLSEELKEKRKLLSLEKFNTSVDDTDRLKNEKDLIGLFLSASPLDDYKTPEEEGCVNISDAIPTKQISLMGIVTNLRIVNRKKDGKPMAFFELEDKSGYISVCCFADQYEKFSSFVEENKIVKISGKIDEQIDDFNEDVKLTLYLQKIEYIQKVLPDIIIGVNSILDWQENVYPYILNNNYQTNNGYKLLILDRLFNEIRTCDFNVSQTILKDEYLMPVIRKK